MSVPYDVFKNAFLSKVSEYEFIQLDDEDRDAIVDGYMRRALTAFKKNCKYDLTSAYDDEGSHFDIDVADEDVDELVEIISEGMVVQWLKPYVYKQELLQNLLNTRDFTSYSPAELLKRVGDAYHQAQKDYTQMIREYSYNHGNLSELHI